MILTVSTVFKTFDFGPFTSAPPFTLAPLESRSRLTLGELHLIAALQQHVYIRTTDGLAGRLS